MALNVFRVCRQTQLELYRAERRCLLEQSEGTRAELERLAGQYSQLLGHQNKKQKIHHIMQLKEENLQLKKVGTPGAPPAGSGA